MDLVTEEQLILATGHSQRGRLAACLCHQGVRFFRGKRGIIWTTKEELNRALHPEHQQKPEDIEF